MLLSTLPLLQVRLPAAVSDGTMLAVVALIAGTVLAVAWVLARGRRTDAGEAGEEPYRSFVENAFDGVYEQTPNGAFRRANPAMARILGYASAAELEWLSPEQAAGIYVLPGRREEFLALLGSGEQVRDFESEIRRPDGTTRWICENVRAVRGERGELRYLQGFVTDTTTRRQAEAALLASEQRYRELFQQSPVAIVEIDSRETMATLHRLRHSGVTDFGAWLAAGSPEASALVTRIKINDLNLAALRMLAAGSVREVQENLHRILTPEAVALRHRALISVWNGSNFVEGETPIFALDGTPRLTLQRWWVPAERGEYHYGRTQLAFIDLTQARATEQALVAERERLSVTLRAMSEAVFTVAADGKVQFMNEAAAELTGWPVAEAVGRSLLEVCRERSGPQGNGVGTLVSAVLRGDEAVDLPPHSVLQSRHEALRQVEGRGAPMHDPSGRTIGVVLVLRDVTQRVRFEADLLRASKMESIGVLAGGIAHDFNNLLSIVMGNLTLAMLDERVLAAGGRWLREAERGTVRAKDLTQQLLTFARGGEPVRTTVRLSDVVAEAAEFALHGSSVRCEFDVAPDLRPADVDKGQIGQVVQNLVINAVQAMPRGGLIRIRLVNEQIDAQRVATLAAGQYVRIEISDTGVGIPPEYLPRVFEPFFTTKEQGTGLGLATVYSVVQKHRGHIDVESAVGCGTTFRLWLPAARQQPAPVPAAPAATLERMTGRVLFMDDEEPIRVMTQALLDRMGLEVVMTSDGGTAVREYAIAQISGKPFDLVIFDLTVAGGMGGAEAMREILKISPNARGIVSSGYSSDPVMANFRAHGFRGSVPKPYRMAEFARTIREVLESR